tara:strand:- start:12308 stop:12631 length:324 start_codon:yes stop_codon:yes gene_type:complete
MSRTYTCTKGASKILKPYFQSRLNDYFELEESTKTADKCRYNGYDQYQADAFRRHPNEGIKRYYRRMFNKQLKTKQKRYVHQCVSSLDYDNKQPMPRFIKDAGYWYY